MAADLEVTSSHEIMLIVAMEEGTNIKDSRASTDLVERMEQKEQCGAKDFNWSANLEGVFKSYRISFSFIFGFHSVFIFTM